MTTEYDTQRGLLSNLHLRTALNPNRRIRLRAKHPRHDRRPFSTKSWTVFLAQFALARDGRGGERFIANGKSGRQIIGDIWGETISVPRARIEDAAARSSECESSFAALIQRLTQTARGADAHRFTSRSTGTRGG